MSQKDLGVIQYINESKGTSRVSRAQEVGAVGQALETGKKILNETIKSNVQDQYVDAIDDALASSQVDAEEYVPQQWGEGTREAYLANRMDKLQSAIKQGKKSHVTAAEMQIKDIMAEAQAKYPWLAEDLQRRAGLAIQGSKAMQQLGIHDAMRTEQAAQAQSEWDTMVNHGRKDWDDGGLGIDPALDPRHPKWMQQYTELQKLRALESEGARATGAALANATLTLNDPSTAHTITETLQGARSSMRKSYQDAMSKAGWYELQRRLRSEKPEDVQWVAEWNNNQRPLLVQELLQVQNNARDFLNDPAIFDQNIFLTDQGKAIKAKWKDGVDEITSVIELINSSGDDLPSAAFRADQIMTVRTLDTFQGLDRPYQQFIAWLTGPGKQMAELAGELRTPEGVTLLNEMSLTARHAMAQASDLWAENGTTKNPPIGRDTAGLQTAVLFNSTGALDVGAAATPADIRSKINARFQDPHQSFVIPAWSDEEHHVLALQNMELHETMFNRVDSLAGGASPEYAGDVLLGLTYSLAYKNGSLTEPRNLAEATLDILASDNTGRAIEAAGRQNKTVAFAQEAQQFYVETQPAVRRKQAGSLYNSEMVGNKTVSELVKVDAKALAERDEFEWIIDEEALNEAAKWEASLGTQFMATKGVIARYKAKLRGEADQVMYTIKDEMDRQINIERNLAKAAGVTRDMSFKSFYEGLGDPQAEVQGAWFDFFNYTSN